MVILIQLIFTSDCTIAYAKAGIGSPSGDLLDNRTAKKQPLAILQAAGGFIGFA